MKKLMFSAVITALMFAGCGGSQNPSEHDGMGAGDGADTTEEPMHPNDTSGMGAPIDTALDTNSMR